VLDVVVIGAGLAGLTGIAFTPALAAAKARAAAENHAGQGVKAWLLARGVPDDFCALGSGTALGYAGATESTERGVLLVGFGPSAAISTPPTRRRSAPPWARSLPRPRCSPSTRTTGCGTRGSRGRWSVLRPGQVHRPWSAVRAPDFGGGHTALPWPSFMDGAGRERAAGGRGGLAAYA
jgi:hypothetical protein